MLTRMTMRNFKRFRDVTVELGNPVVFIGPNNSGKTTALQGLALWSIGLIRWLEKRQKGKSEKRPGVAINRKDLIAVPVPAANLLWRDLHVRDVVHTPGNGKTVKTRNVRVEIIVEGVSGGKEWKCGLEFDYNNEESLYCRPIRLSKDTGANRMPIPDEARRVFVSFVPPMSGLAANERRLDPGALNVLLGEGRTAEVLRNLCFLILLQRDGASAWKALCERIEALFGAQLDEPTYVVERGEVVMTYRNPNGVRLDISTAGRGLQQTLLLLAHLYLNPNTVLLLDEPDAHLEILRQREIYGYLSEFADKQGSQIIIASHSEVILNEAAGRDVVVAFVGRPHRIDDRGSQLLKSLKSIGYDHYYQAEQTGWVLYLEGPTDLSILKSFARTLKHPVAENLNRPFVHYIQNKPNEARSHFRGLQEAKKELVGFVLCDRLGEGQVQSTRDLHEYAWKRREIENYLCQPETLVAYARRWGTEAIGPLFALSSKSQEAMEECIADFVPRAAIRDRSDRWWSDTKATDEFLDRLFEAFFAKLGMKNQVDKSDYHHLASLVPERLVDPEVRDVLDGILRVAKQAKAASSHS